MVNVHSIVLTWQTHNTETKLNFQSEVIKGHRSEEVKLHFPINTTIHTLLCYSVRSLDVQATGKGQTVSAAVPLTPSSDAGRWSSL